MGLEDPNNYKNVLHAQYFSTDYNELSYDADNMAIDVGTQLIIINCG